MNELCTACLSTGRNLYFIGKTGFYDIYMQILTEIPVYDLTQICIQVCWECRAVLKRMDQFKQLVKKSYSMLMHLQLSQNSKSLSQTSNLKIHSQVPISIPEQTDELKVETLDLEDDIKTEVEEHDEPLTFVNDLEIEVEDLEQKNAKVKAKKKGKRKKEKIKVKKKRKISSDISIVDNGLSDGSVTDYAKCDKDIDGKDLEIEKKAKVKKTKVTDKQNGVKQKEILDEKPKCVECGKIFSSRKTYRYHLNVLHKGQNRYPCPRCGKVYQWKSNLGRHLRSHKAVDTGELYCATCDKRFASIATFRQHIKISRRHVSETEFSFMCNECGKKFVNKTRLRDHIDWEHLNKIKFKCQLCNKPFKCHTSLYVHMQNVHRNKEKKDNLCHVCGKSYQNAAKLKYHIVAMHTSETPYQCSQCSSAFGWYSSLYRHVREVHYKMKVQPKKSKKCKRLSGEVLPSILPPHAVTQPGPS